MRYTQDQYSALERTLFKGVAVEERIAFVRLFQEYLRVLDPPQVLKQAMDVGSVTGFYPAFFLHMDLETVAVNSDNLALHYLKEHSFYSPYAHYGAPHLSVVQGDVGALPIKEESVDVITIMGGTFSHLQIGKHQPALWECSRILRNGGCLIISDWNIANPHQDFFGLYHEQQREELKSNHFGYPFLLESLATLFSVPKTYVHSDGRMYIIGATKKK